MLSYRHAYHAGNFADVMKHVVLTAILKYMAKKDAGFCYIDTHAGAGGYDLKSDYALKTNESTQGIAKLWHVDDAPGVVADYLALVRSCNTEGELVRYPGSPWFAEQLMRRQDRLALCELHSTDFPKLEAMFADNRRVHCHYEDAYSFAPSLTPPIERRGVVLMDPSFEVHGEYETAVATIAKMHRKFATGTYALWYPILDEERAETLRTQIGSLAIRDVLHLQMRVADSETHPGMYGSGMIVINPPWTLKQEMETALEYLTQALAVDDTAGWQVEQWVKE